MARSGRPVRRSPLGHVVRVLLTFHIVCVAWIFFRAESFQAAWAVFAQLGTLTTFHPNLHGGVVAVLVLGLVTHWIPERWYERARSTFIGAPAFVQGYVLLLFAIAVRQMAFADAVPFVYFQF
jgi:hypothetical protein